MTTTWPPTRLKENELIIATDKARNEVAKADKMTDEELARLEKKLPN